MFASLPHAPDPMLASDTWHPQTVEVQSWRGVPLLFLHCQGRHLLPAASCCHVTLNSLEIPSPLWKCIGSSHGVKPPASWGGEGKDLQTDVPCPCRQMWAFWRSCCARMLLAKWQACIVWAGNAAMGLLNKILGLRTVALDIALDLSYKGNIFSNKFSKA